MKTMLLKKTLLIFLLLAAAPAYSQWCTPYIYDSSGVGSWAPRLNIGGRGHWDYSSCPAAPMYGIENFVKFMPAATGYYDVEIDRDDAYPYKGDFTFFTRPSGTCDISGSTCRSPYFTDIVYDKYFKYMVGPLTANTSYDLIVDAADSTYPHPLAQLQMIIRCPAPASISFSDIEPTSVKLNLSCYCAIPYIEYGPSGFTPGTGTTAGVNGTIITNVTFPYVLNGLTPATNYDFYARNCCGNKFSGNTVKITQRTPVNCASTRILSCGSSFEYDTYYYVNAAWPQQNSYINDAKAVDSVFSFTPSTTGIYSVFVGGYWANLIFGYNPTAVYIKQAGLCNETGWTLAGNFANYHSSFTPVAISLGNLSAGTTYYIMVQGIEANINILNAYRYYFRLDCPVTVSLKCFLQSYYTGNGTMTPALKNEGVSLNPTEADTVSVTLVDSASRNIIQTAKGVLHTDGTLSVTFPATVTGFKYYLKVTHRNTVETWSANTLTMSNGILYDFTTASNKAYGSNMIDVNNEGVWSFYSGDINQDGGIDATDFLVLYPDIQAGKAGYLATDVNGDGGVDGNDFLMLYPNIQKGRGTIHP